jgi:peptidoglycan/LPS O-acetylase OafA/YrhL
LLIFIVHLKLPSELTAEHPWLERMKEFGWIGVPVFFVLSGYLITALALEEGKDFSVWRFYARRALRLWPLYFIAALLAIAAWQVPLLRAIHVGTSPHWAMPLFTFTLNFAVRSNWAPWEAIGLAAVFWTLAVEEQFYALWAPVVRWCSDQSLILIALAIVLASLITRFTIQFSDYFLFFRMSTLVSFGPIMLGCTLALIGVRQFNLSSAASNALLIALIVAAFIIAFYEWPFPTDSLHSGLLLTAVDLYCLVLIILALCGSGVVRLLVWRPLRRLGDLSYASYVMHLGIFYFYYNAARSWLPSLARVASPAALVALDAVILFALTLTLARVWYALETPLRELRARLRVQRLPVSEWNRAAAPSAFGGLPIKSQPSS